MYRVRDPVAQTREFLLRLHIIYQAMESRSSARLDLVALLIQFK